MNDSFQHICVKQVQEISGDDHEFLAELVDIFLAQIPDFVDKMNKELSAQNWSKLAREAHTAKSSAMTFGMEKTGVLLKTIQLRCEENKPESLPSLVQQAIEQLEGAVPELQQFKHSL
jgi:HPt (histidine-containing phosphotransfer) domain-containing protein